MTDPFPSRLNLRLWQAGLLRVGVPLLAFPFAAIAIVVAGGSPLAVAETMWQGAFGSLDRLARVIATLVPLLLCACGLAFTFAAGLYNLGIEGQIALGAIASTWVLRLAAPLTEQGFPPALAIALALLGGMAGGIGWSLLAALLNIYAQVNEIFAGLGTNFIAQGLALYLVFGPWRREGAATMSGTELFEPSLWLPTVGSTEASPVAIAIAVLGFVATIVALRGTYFGLKLKAVGFNRNAAANLGVPSARYLLWAFALCGALAGLAGSLQVLAVFHRLIPSISSGLGFLGLLVAMLVGYDPRWMLPVAFGFSALNVGGLQLPLALQLESSVAGIVQGSLLLFALLGRGIATRYAKWGRAVTGPPQT